MLEFQVMIDDVSAGNGSHQEKPPALTRDKPSLATDNP